MLSVPKIFNALFVALTPRQREVVSGRFGLDKTGEGETLASIGERLNVTRERVRQIEKSALDVLSKKIVADTACVQIFARSKKQLKNAGGAMRKEAFLNQVGDSVEGLKENHLALLIEASHEFYSYPEDGSFWPFYYLNKPDLRMAVNFVDGWIGFLKDHKTKILSGLYKPHLADFIKARRIDKNYAENYLSISKKIHTSPFGDVGLAEWPEIKPLTTRDRIYLILKKEKKPLHFETIAKAINEARLGTSTALAPTVHNELIKDPRFVLVGRGTYALKEHGYEPGIAREVIQKILKKHGPLRVDDVVAQMSKQRLFKQNTILINLQNKSYFERLSDGRYRVREA